MKSFRKQYLAFLYVIGSNLFYFINIVYYIQLQLESNVLSTRPEFCLGNNLGHSYYYKAPHIFLLILFPKIMHLILLGKWWIDVSNLKCWLLKNTELTHESLSIV